MIPIISVFCNPSFRLPSHLPKRKNIFIVPILLLSVLSLTGCQLEKVDPFKQEITNALDRFYQGERFFQQRDYEAARQEYLASLEISPRPLTYFRLSQISALDQDYDQAIAYLDESLKLSPGFESAVSIRQQMEGRRMSMLNQESSRGIPETTQDLDEPESISTAVEPDISSASISPRLVTEPDYLAMKTAQNEQNWSEAAVLGLKLLDKYPEDASLLYQVGYASVQLGVYDEAQKYFEQSLEIEPEQGPVWNDLGVTLENRGQVAEAQRAYEQAVEQGSSPDAFFNLAKIYEKQGMYREAIVLYERYVTFDSASPFGINAQERIEALRRLVY